MEAKLGEGKNYELPQKCKIVKILSITYWRIQIKVIKINQGMLQSLELTM